MNALTRIHVEPAGEYVVLGVMSPGGDGSVVVLTAEECGELRMRLLEAEIALRGTVRE